MRDRISLGSGYLEIYENLNHCLKELRSRAAKSPGVDEPYIWVDAVCINQENIEERGQQVNLMNQIYSRCLKVLS